MFLARLKPLSERKGHKVKVFMISGSRFYVDRGWYEVTDELAAKLRPLHQDHYDLESPSLFDVCTHEEAERLEQAERAASATARATIKEPASPVSYRRAEVPSSNDMTTADLNQSASGSNPDEGRRLGIGRVQTSSEPAPAPASDSTPAPAAAARGPKQRRRR